MMSNKDAHSYIISAIREMLEGNSVEMCKTGFSVLNTVINCSADLLMV